MQHLKANAKNCVTPDFDGTNQPQQQQQQHDDNIQQLRFEAATNRNARHTRRMRYLTFLPLLMTSIEFYKLCSQFV